MMIAVYCLFSLLGRLEVFFFAVGNNVAMNIFVSCVHMLHRIPRVKFRRITGSKDPPIFFTRCQIRKFKNINFTVGI
jgi:hypothetical protein